MKKSVAFTIADENNLVHAEKLEKSFHHFHPDIELIVYEDKDVGSPQNYYRATPMFGKELLKEYETVLKLDSDQIITGNLDYLFEEPYDVGVVMNFNRVDIKKYGPVQVYDISPREYMNCGLVAMRSRKFAEHWWKLCNTPRFPMLRYREQDFLNILIQFGDYEVECFDFPNKIKNYQAWHGLVAKGEYAKCELRDGKIILPKADDRYPEHDKEIKVLHTAGGKDERKIGDTYRIYFNDEIIEYIDGLIGANKEKDAQTKKKA